MCHKKKKRPKECGAPRLLTPPVLAFSTTLKHPPPPPSSGRPPFADCVPSFVQDRKWEHVTETDAKKLVSLCAPPALPPTAFAELSAEGESDMEVCGTEPVDDEPTATAPEGDTEMSCEEPPDAGTVGCSAEGLAAAGLSPDGQSGLVQGRTVPMPCLALSSHFCLCRTGTTGPSQRDPLWTHLLRSDHR